MPRPTSFRLPDDLLQRLDEEAAARGTSVTALVTTLLDEGLEIRRFPGVTYRDGPAGRRAALVGGPDIWEIVRAIQDAPGRGDARLRAIADRTDLSLSQVRVAVDFYAAHPEEIDRRLEAERRERARSKMAVERREQLLSS